MSESQSRPFPEADRRHDRPVWEDERHYQPEKTAAHGIGQTLSINRRCLGVLAALAAFWAVVGFLSYVALHRLGGHL